MAVKIRLTRGTPISPGKHGNAGEVHEFDASTAAYLVSIGHERVVDPPAEEAKGAELEQAKEPQKAKEPDGDKGKVKEKK